MKGVLRLGLILASLNMIPAYAGAEQQEIDAYINTFQNGSWKEQTSICNELQWSGISDPRLFDVIEAKLLGLLSAETDKNSLDIIAWYSKALGMSGKDKYLGTLDKVVASGNKKLVKYGREGIDLIPKYKKWNPIISSSKNFRADKTLRLNRFANMLKSDEWELQLIAAKRMNYEKITDSYMLDTLNSEILGGYPAIDKAADEDRLDAFQWMIRSLAALGAPKYLETLQEISTKASSKGLVGFTKKTIKKYY
jgi:hypothetical protein